MNNPCSTATVPSGSNLSINIPLTILMSFTSEKISNVFLNRYINSQPSNIIIQTQNYCSWCKIYSMSLNAKDTLKTIGIILFLCSLSLLVISCNGNSSAELDITPTPGSYSNLHTNTRNRQPHHNRKQLLSLLYLDMILKFCSPFNRSQKKLQIRTAWLFNSLTILNRSPLFQTLKLLSF